VGDIVIAPEPNSVCEKCGAETVEIPVNGGEVVVDVAPRPLGLVVLYESGGEIVGYVATPEQIDRMAIGRPRWDFHFCDVQVPEPR
jgi:hypothetical protein